MNSRLLLIFSILLFTSTRSEPLGAASDDSVLLQGAKPEKEALDVNKINSSVDAGSFYSVDVSIKLFEDNIIKMAQELKRLKQQVEFAKQMEQKRLAQIQKLEQENAKLCKLWLDSSLTGTSAKLEPNYVESKLDSNMIQPVTQNIEIEPVRQDVKVELVGTSSQSSNN